MESGCYTPPWILDALDNLSCQRGVCDGALHRSRVGVCMCLKIYRGDSSNDRCGEGCSPHGIDIIVTGVSGTINARGSRKESDAITNVILMTRGIGIRRYVIVCDGAAQTQGCRPNISISSNGYNSRHPRRTNSSGPVAGIQTPSPPHPLIVVWRLSGTEFTTVRPADIAS